MRAPELLGALIAASSGDLLTPHKPRGAAIAVALPLSLLDALDLGQGRWLAVVRDASGDRWTAPLMMVEGRVRRAIAGDGVAEAVLALLTAASPHGAFEVQAWHGEAVEGERAVTVDQTDESLIVGERAMVKWAVRLPAPGVGQPARDRLITLAAQGFSAMPTPWGLITWGTPGERSLLVATVTEYLPGAQDGWDWAVEDVRRLARGEITLDEALAPAGQLGSLTASLHAALAGTGVEAAEAAEVARWSEQAHRDLDQALSGVAGSEGVRLTAWAPAIRHGFGAFTGAAGTPLIDVHGDFHLGQILRQGSPPRYAVIDFDGNPVLDAAERTRRRPAALDVAGMLAALDHAARIVVHRTEGIDPAPVRAWIGAAQARYLRTYRAGLAERGASALFDERLLGPLRLHQEVREYLYAIQHLPLWIYVPDAALADLLPAPAPEME